MTTPSRKTVRVARHSAAILVGRSRLSGSSIDLVHRPTALSRPPPQSTAPTDAFRCQHERLAQAFGRPRVRATLVNSGTVEGDARGRVQAWMDLAREKRRSLPLGQAHGRERPLPGRPQKKSGTLPHEALAPPNRHPTRRHGPLRPPRFRSYCG